MSTLKVLRSQLRKQLDDEVGSSSDSYWSDSELNEYLNEGYFVFCRLTKIIRDSLSAVCLLTLEAGDQHLPVSSTILKYERVKPSWDTRPLTETLLSEIELQQPGWETDTGTPTEYLLDYSSGYLSLNRAVEAAGTLRLTVRRMPLAEMVDADEPQFSPAYHYMLKTYALYRAFSKQDSEIKNPEKADKYLYEFRGRDELYPAGHVGRVTMEISEPLPNVRNVSFL